MVEHHTCKQGIGRSTQDNLGSYLLLALRMKIAPGRSHSVICQLTDHWFLSTFDF